MKSLGMKLAFLVSVLVLVNWNMNQVEANPNPELENQLGSAAGEKGVMETAEEIEPMKMELESEGSHRAKRMKRQYYSGRHIFCGTSGRPCDTHVDCCVEYGYKCHDSGICFYHPGPGVPY